LACCVADSKEEVITIKSNSLGNAGPATSPRSIVYEGISAGCSDGSHPNVDLAVTEQTPGSYRGDRTQNRLKGQVMQINLAAETSTTFQLSLKDPATGNKTTAERLLLHVYDLSRGPEDTALTGVQALGWKDFYEREDNSLKEKTVADGNTWFVSEQYDMTQKGVPSDPYDMTSAQRQQMVTFEYRLVDTITVTFKVGPGSQGHNFGFFVQMCTTCKSETKLETLTTQAHAYVKSAMDSEQITLWELVAAVDSDKSGNLSRAEFVALFERVKGDFTVGELDTLYGFCSKENTVAVGGKRISSVFSIPYSDADIITTVASGMALGGISGGSGSGGGGSGGGGGAGSGGGGSGGASSALSASAVCPGFDPHIADHLLAICDPGKGGLRLEVKVNNLAGLGPQQTAAQELRYGGIPCGCPSGGPDLLVTAGIPGQYGTDLPGSKNNNGVNGQIMRVHVAAGSSVDLTLRLRDPTSEQPVMVQEALLYFYNLNQALDGKSRSAVSPLDFAGWYIDPSSELVKNKDEMNNRWWFISSDYTPEVEPPMDWGNLSPQNRDQTLELRYINVDKINVKLKVTPGAKGHDFLFTLVTCVKCAPTTPTTTTTGLPYDCDSDFAKWQRAWSQDKTEWCCQHAKRGCQGTTTKPKYDCDAGFATWQRSWSRDKMFWCCDRAQKGCDGTTTPPKYDCSAGFSNWREVWSPSKVSWCCTNAGRGCSTVPGKGGDVLFDCNAGYDPPFQDQWSPEKKVWCCSHSGRGCAIGNGFDCNDGYAKRHDTWTAPKKQWCCDNAGICEVAKPLALLGSIRSFDCSDGASCDPCQKSWPKAKQHFCCANGGLGCLQPDLAPADTTVPATTTSAPRYDCDANAADWERSWTPNKRKFCCASTGRSCSGTFDCGEGYSKWPVMWSEAKQQWCCQYQSRGCTTTTLTTVTPIPYDCDAALKHWVDAWSKPKKTWCCEHKGRGCNVPVTTTTLLYDCFADYTDCQECLWKRWSAAKRGWCCKREGRGCPTTTTPIVFDCDAGYANWAHGWSDEKRGWCCKHFYKGCPTTSKEPFACSGQRLAWGSDQRAYCCKIHGKCAPPPPAAPQFDCDAGYSNWQDGWSSEKKYFCCQSAKRGCPQTLAPYNCADDYQDCAECVQASWSPGKLSWCCQHEQVGCPTTSAPTLLAFDCDAGLANWRNGWSRGKQQWCCAHAARGCGYGMLAGPAASQAAGSISSVSGPWGLSSRDGYATGGSLGMSMYQRKFGEEGAHVSAASWFPAPSLASSCLSLAFLAGLTGAYLAFGGGRREGVRPTAYVALPTADIRDVAPDEAAAT